jgi:hypothetical protein
MPVRLADHSRRLLGLAQAIHRWLGQLAALDEARRAKVADYADEVAATLARAGEALARLELEPADKAAGRQAIRELGRISGYVETIVGVLEHHFDGRKLAGVKRRLELLQMHEAPGRACDAGHRPRINRLLAAEGYFRALADGLRA